MSLPFVSVIVPVYNAVSTIEHCVQSLLNLDYPRERVELIVVDNASTDGTASILSRVGRQLRLLHERTRGPAAARNCGLRSATHELVAMTDADCVVDAQWLQKLVAPLRNPDVAMVGGRILSIQPSNAIEQFGEEIHDHAAAITQFVPPYVITMNWATRKAHLELLGYFDETFLRAEDVELSYRFARAGLRFAYAPDALVFHHNERTFAGLFREGYVHGVHSQQLTVVHGDWLRTNNSGTTRGRPLRAFVRALGEFANSNDRARSFHRAVFTMGKEFGKLAGAQRFRQPAR